MKNTLLLLGAAALLFLFANTAIGQGLSLKTIPNPDAGVAYQGGPVEYKGNLYFAYRPTAGLPQMGVFNGDSITLVPNPVSGGVVAPLIVYNNLLYLEYYNRALGVYQIATFDGTNFTFIPNPDASTSPYSYLTIYNNKLCFEYNATQLAEYDGTKWKLFNAPSNGGFTFQGGLTLYKNNLYMGYQTTPPFNVRQLMEFNDTAMTLINNPDAATAFSPFGGGYQGYPILYNNNLYFKYVNIAGVEQIAQYNDTAVILIPNPDASPYGYGLGTGGFPVVYNGALYIQYLNASHIAQLAKYDGKVTSLIANPDSSGSYQGAPIVYDSSLYVQYQDAAGIYRLGKYNGKVFTLIANPDKSPHGYANYNNTGAGITPPFIYGRGYNVALNTANLYIQYEDSMGNNRLAQYNDTVLTLVRNPDTAKTFQTGYVGSPVAYNNQLYVQYYGADAVYHIAYLFDSSGTLPVMLLNFTVQPKGPENLLQWQTASEVNSSYFTVQRSTSGTSFATVGRVNAAGNSAALLNYSYTDVLPTNLTAPVIYYRLQQVDKNGQMTYSNIVEVHMAGGTDGFSIAPNPVTNVINLHTGTMAGNAAITVQDMGGRIIYTGQQTITAGQTIQLNALPLANGVYILTVKCGNALYKFKIIKAQ